MTATYQPISNQNATAVYELIGAFAFHRSLCDEHAKRKHWREMLVGKRVLTLDPKRHDCQCFLCFKADNPVEFES